MKLKKFVDFLNEEATIMPLDITSIIDAIRDNASSIESLEDINKYINSDVLEFVNYDTFYATLRTEKEKKGAPPKGMNINNGIQFALVDKYSMKMYVVVLPEFIKALKGSSLNRILSFLSEVIRHESVHLQQLKRSDKAYSLDRSPAVNQKEYFAHPSEQMAYALSFVDNMKEKGYSKAEMLDAIRNKKRTGIWIQDAYGHVLDDKQFQKFMRYVYDYINDIKE